jgi:hypothetical protein
VLAAHRRSRRASRRTAKNVAIVFKDGKGYDSKKLLDSVESAVFDIPIKRVLFHWRA